MASRGAYSHVICYFVDGRAKARANFFFFKWNYTFPNTSISSTKDSL